MRRLATIAVLTALHTAAVTAHAQQADPQALEDARWQFSEGTAHFQGRRYAEAISAFERSNAIVPSPNADLMIARSLRELGKRVEAANQFERAEKGARKRVAAGEPKYGQTADAARTEGDKVRATLGSLSIHVAKPSGSTVTVDGKEIALSSDGEANLLHEPGTAVVVVRDSSGAKQRQTISVNAGTSARMDFAGESTGATPPPPVVGPPPPTTRPTPTKSDGSSSWTVPAAFVTGGITLAGVGLFTGFGLSSKATFDDLRVRCGPSSCTDADRAEADSGARAQTIANVSLVVAGVAAVATIVLIVASTR